MEKVEQCLERLKKAGFMITNQRKSILGFLKNNRNHPTAEDVYQEIRKIHPSASFRTVCKTLQTLRDIGEIRELAIDSMRIHYDPDTREHVHIFCENCGAIEDLIWSDFMVRNARAFGFGKLPFKVHRVQICLIGFCENCSAKEQRNSETQTLGTHLKGLRFSCFRIKPDPQNLKR